jgi:VanZ family protein
MLMGGVIEILQAYCTGGRRSGDWIDFLADAVGVLLAQLICIPLARRLAKRRKER